jgi:hypothetical protein
MRDCARRDLDQSSALIEGFAGVELDETAREAILEVLRGCAARRRAIAGTLDDPDQLFIAAEQPFEEVLVRDEGYSTPRRERRQRPPLLPDAVMPEQMLEHSTRLLVQPGEQFRSSDAELSWEMFDDEEGMQAIEEAVASVKAARALPSNPSPLSAPSSLGEGDDPQGGGGADV